MPLFRPLAEDFDDHIGRLPNEIDYSTGFPIPGINHYDLRSFHNTDLTVPQTMPDFKYWNAAHFNGTSMLTLSNPRSIVGRSVAARTMGDLDLLDQAHLDEDQINELELFTLQSGNEGWPISDPDVVIGRDATLRYSNSMRVNLLDGVTKTVASSFRDNIIADLPADGSNYYIELALPNFPSNVVETAGAALTESGNEITDATRAIAVAGDGRGYNPITNLVTNGGMETNATGWGIGGAGGTSVARVTTTALFGTASLKVITVSGANNGAQFSDISGNGVPVSPNTSYTASVYVRGEVGGEQVYLSLESRDSATVSINTFAISSNITLTTGWQRITVSGTTPINAAFARIRVQQPGIAVQTFYIDGVQFEVGTTANAYIETNGAAVTQVQGTPDSSTGIWEATTNLVQNGSFTTNTTGWTAGAGAFSIARNTQLGKFGPTSLLSTTVPVSGRALASYDVASLVAATAYTYSAWLFVPAAYAGATLALRAGMQATLSGNEITDATRTTATQGDGNVRTNLFGYGQCDTIGNWFTALSGVVASVDTTMPAPFSTNSVKYVADGTVANQGAIPSTAAAQNAGVGANAVGSIWFKGVAGQSYLIRTRWVNTDASATDGTATTLNATGSWQLVTPASVAVASGKIGDQLAIMVRINGQRAETFWVANVMLEKFQTVVAPYIPTAGGTIATSGIDSSFGVWEGTTNYCPNGGFETNNVGWGIRGVGTTVTRSSDKPKFGGWGGKVVTPGTAADEGASGPDSPAASASAGQVWVGSAWVYTDTAFTLQFGLEESSPSAYIAGTYQNIALVPGWNRLQGARIIGSAAADRVKMIFSQNGVSGIVARTWYIDGIQYELRRTASSLTVSGNEITDATRTTNTQGDGIATPDSSYGIWESTTNACTNGGFETNLTGWVAAQSSGTPPTNTRITTDAKFGTASLETSIPVATNGGAARFNITYATSTQYTISFWYKAIQNGTGGTPSLIGIYNAVQVSATTVLNTTVDGVWRRAAVTFTTDGSSQAASYLDFRINGTVATQPYIYRIDGVQIETKPIATPYVHTDGSTATRSAGRVQAPASFSNATQGWVAFRLRMEWGNAGITGASFPTLFDWRTDASNKIQLYYTDSVKKWTIESRNANLQNSATSAVQTFNPGDFVTVVAYWTASNVAISVNGSAFTIVARTTGVPTLPGTTFDIGSTNASQNIDSEVLWTLFGTGTLSDANAGTINGFGNTDPNVDTAPGTTTAVWAALTATYTLPGVSGLIGTPYYHTDGGSATRAAGRIQAPPVLLSPSQGWIAMRVKINWPSTSVPVGGNPEFFSLSDGTLNNRIQLRYAGAVGKWTTDIVSAGTGGGNAQVNGTIAAGDIVTLILRWAAGACDISVNGAAFSHAAGGTGTFTAPVSLTQFDIGSSEGSGLTGRQMDSDIYWLVTGSGTLSDADAVTINAFGNNDPDFPSTPGTPNAVFPFNTGFYRFGIASANMGLRDQWQKVVLPYTAPASGTISHELAVTAQSAVRDQVFLDGVQVEQKVFATPYVQTDGGTAARTIARVQGPVSNYIDETRGWVALRWRVPFSSNASNYPSASPRVFSWGDDANNRIGVYVNSAAGNGVLSLQRISGGTTASVNTSPITWAAGDYITILAAWTATTIKLSVNGSAFVSAASTAIPVLAATLFNIGSYFDGTQLFNGDAMWTIVGRGTLTDADATTANGWGNTDPHWYGLPPVADARISWSADTANTLAAGSRLDLANSFIDFTSDVAYDPAKTDSIPFTASLNPISAGGNTFFRINRDSLVNANLSNLSGIRFRLKPYLDMSFVAQAMRIYKAGDFTFPSVAVDTKRNALSLEVPQVGVNAAGGMVSTNPIYFTGVRPKNAVQVARFNTGHLTVDPDDSIVTLYFRSTSATGNKLYSRMKLHTTASVLDLFQITDGATPVNISTTSSGALINDTDYFLVTEVADDKIRATIYRSKGAFFGAQIMTSGWITTSLIQRGEIGYAFAAKSFDFSVDWVRNSHAEFAKYESVSEASIRPMIGATIYPETTPAIDLTDQNFIVSGDATLTTDPNFGAPAPSTKFVRTGASFFGGLQTTNFIFVGDVKHSYLTGKLFPQSTLYPFRILLIDKNDTVAFMQYIQDLKVGQWNEFTISLNAVIAPEAYRVVIQQVGFVAGTFWLQDFKLNHDSFAWSASPNGGTNWYQFYNATDAPYKGVNFKPTPGNMLRVRAVSLTDSARIIGAEVVPHYGYVGQVRPDLLALIPSSTLFPSDLLSP